MNSPEALWRLVEKRTHQVPYVYASLRYAHLDAARDLAKELGLQGEEFAAFLALVERKTLWMSRFVGD